MKCQSPNRELYAGEYLSQQVHNPKQRYLAIRLEIKENGKFVQNNTKENSMMIAYEIPVSVYEYMPNKLVVHLDPTDLLLVDSWHPIRLI